MKRRQALFRIAGFAIGLAAALESSAQPAAKAPVIGLLDVGERTEWWAAFRQQMGELGYVEGKNVVFEARYAGGKFERLPTLAQELVRLNVALIVSSGTEAALAA